MRLAQVPVPLTPPAPVTTAGVNEVTLNWAPVPGAAGYNIYRSTVSGGQGNVPYRTGVTTTSFDDAALSADLTYFYQVSAVNVLGEGPRSVELSVTPRPATGTWFADDFNGAVNPAWKFVNGTWTQSAGVLSQTATSLADPRKAVLIDQSYPANVEITAKVRVDSWTDGDAARAGVGLYTDPVTGKGYNLVFHQTGGTRNKVQFLNDGVAWGNAYNFNWDLDTWYYFKLKIVNGVLYGKVWQEGAAEPTAWMFQRSGWTNRTGGAPALNGGSAISGKGGATVSFADVAVRGLS